MKSNKRILIVDDEPTILLALSHVLKTEGVEIITSSKMERAEEAVERYFFDLVIADIKMSGVLGKEGLELLTYLRNKSPETRVIIMTGYGSPEIKEEAYVMGAYYYYDKPVDITHLLGMIKKLGIPVKA